MQSKIIFFSESETFGKAPRDFEDARTEFGWSIMLDAEWSPINVRPNERYDLEFAAFYMFHWEQLI